MTGSRRQLLAFVFVGVVPCVNAQRTLAATTVITNVIPDATQTSVFIYGQNFCTSPLIPNRSTRTAAMA